MSVTLGQLALVAQGCRSVRRVPAALRFDDLVVELKGDRAVVRDAIAPALAALAPYDLSLRGKVHLVVHLAVRDFVIATGKTDAWMRAWTTYDRVDLLHPRHWSNGKASVVQKRVTHEFVHLATFRALGSKARAARIRPAAWFVEGLASLVAEQRRLPLEQLANARNPLIVADDPASAYAAAHHTAAFLRQAFGSRFFVEVLEVARDGGAAGAVERAVFARTGGDLDTLWTSVLSATSNAQ